MSEPTTWNEINGSSRHEDRATLNYLYCYPCQLPGRGFVSRQSDDLDFIARDLQIFDQPWFSQVRLRKYIPSFDMAPSEKRVYNWYAEHLCDGQTSLTSTGTSHSLQHHAWCSTVTMLPSSTLFKTSSIGTPTLTTPAQMSSDQSTRPIPLELS